MFLSSEPVQGVRRAALTDAYRLTSVPKPRPRALSSTSLAATASWTAMPTDLYSVTCSAEVRPGFGTCFVGLRVAEQNRQVKELLGVPEQVELVTVLPFGYRLQGMQGTGRKQRKSLDEVTHRERFGQRYESG